MFSVCPDARSPMTATRIASGIDVHTRITLRQLPRNSRIMMDTRADARAPSRSTPSMAPRTNTDWSKSILSSRPSGAAARIVGRSSRVASTTASVEASDLRRMARYVARRPLTRTMLVWSAKPSEMRATSPRSTGTPPLSRTGICRNWSMVAGLEFRNTA